MKYLHEPWNEIIIPIHDKKMVQVEGWVACQAEESYSKKNWERNTLKCAWLVFEMLGFRFYRLSFNRNLLCWNSFQKLQVNGETTFFFLYVARYPEFLYEFLHFMQISNILKYYLSQNRKSSEKTALIWYHIEYFSHFNSRNAVTWFREIKNIATVNSIPPF